MLICVLHPKCALLGCALHAVSRAAQTLLRMEVEMGLS